MPAKVVHEWQLCKCPAPAISLKAGLAGRQSFCFILIFVDFKKIKNYSKFKNWNSEENSRNVKNAWSWQKTRGKSSLSKIGCRNESKTIFENIKVWGELLGIKWTVDFNFIFLQHRFFRETKDLKKSTKNVSVSGIEIFFRQIE